MLWIKNNRRNVYNIITQSLLRFWKGKVMNMNLFQGKKAICLFLSVSLMIFCFAPYRLRAEENSSAYYSVECGKEFEVNTVIVAKWNNHSTIDFKIKNTGEEKIDDWYLTFNTLYDVEDIWNASIIDSDENGTYLIKCEEWNQDILIKILRN